VTIADQEGLDIRQLWRRIVPSACPECGHVDGYRSVNGEFVQIIPGGHGRDYPASVWRIKDQKAST
jgi:hypothetical protein